MKKVVNPALIILDRDGVINLDSDNYIKSPEEWIPIPGSIEAIAKLNRANIKVAVATNQSGIARQYFDIHVLDAMHSKMNRLVTDAGGKIDHIAFCPHGPSNNCQCRKPKPGLLSEISSILSIPLSPEIIMVGDSIRDLEAAMAAGCTPVLVKTGKGIRSMAKIQQLALNHPLQNIGVFENLSDFVDHTLSNQ